MNSKHGKKKFPGYQSHRYIKSKLNRCELGQKLLGYVVLVLIFQHVH